MTRSQAVSASCGLIGGCLINAVATAFPGRVPPRGVVRDRSSLDGRFSAPFGSLWTLGASGALTIYPILSSDPRAGGSTMGDSLVGGFVQAMIVPLWAGGCLARLLAASFAWLTRSRRT